MKRLGLGITVVFALGVVLGVALFFQRQHARPSILLVTIDTLRADAIGAIGGGAQTPVLDQLIREGTLFDRAVAAAPQTGPSHASILSGEFSYHHGVRNNGQSLGSNTRTLATRLHERGYATAAFISGFPLNHMFGFDHGFDRYDDDFGASKNQFALSERKAEATTLAALAWLKQPRNKPWFAWVHYYDAHAPYEPPAAFRQPGPRGDYLGEVAYVDHWLGELVKAVRTTAPNTIIVITSDHGEGLGDHGEFDHGLLLYQSTIRVPLLVIAPGIAKVQRSTQPVRSVDIAPTLLDLTGATGDQELDGVDLRPTLSGAVQEIPPAYSETYFGSLTYGWAPLRSLQAEQWKRIESVGGKLFDLAHDPGEKDPVNAPVINARLESLLAQSPEPRPSATASDSADAEAMAKLRSLGYLGAGATVDAKRWDASIDPKQHLAEHNEILRAQQSLDQGQFAMAEGRYRAILELSPDNRVAWLRLGTLLARTGRRAEAATTLQRASELDPLNPEAHYEWAQVLTDSRRFHDAAAQWAEVTRLQPQRAVAWSNLGTSLLMDGNKAAALEALNGAVRIDPESADLRENLARVQLLAGDDAAAIASLLELARLQSQRFTLAAVLAQRLAESGRVEDSEQWLARSRPGQESYVDAHIALAISEAHADKDKAALHLREAMRIEPQRREAILADKELAALVE